MQSQLKHPLLKFSDEVKDALHTNKPIVSLESSGIVHGLPYPENLALAHEVENAVRSAGAVPATLGIEGGKVLVGMNGAGLDRFASMPGMARVSSRDLPVILAKGVPGATTVASALMVADLAGIQFFASADFGGIHGGMERTMDVSTDLIQLTRSRVAVVCGGLRSVLDLGLTTEYLETHGVPIIAHRSDHYVPAHYISGGIQSPHRVDDEEVIAHALEKHWSLGNRSAVLITSPVYEAGASDCHEVPQEMPQEMEAEIKKAIKKAELAKVKGSELTPYMMAAVRRVLAQRTKTHRAHRAALLSTAELAGRLAKVHGAFCEREEAARICDSILNR
jgi:pseudouridine-5'-phosphate glycosidase